ncbi:hypothetical protein PHLCEN_2v7936 [Hermanssonia centrifuga]|uniref:Major facilitator superfamily (MFS) profile domain-containing protein n=1 Tax=Hermanssonia centrifuga TaxID=98765 RepID=A0A2R6NV50_9APHY|nr:hypothetical protein PHLCEN_2v7936 [Hermanssonia centrifuga]
MSINALQGFAHFIPLIWLPTFAAASGLSTAQSSLALTLVNASSVFAGFIMGFLSDKFNIWALALGSLVCTSLVTFVLWGVLSYSLGGILAYGIAYGGTAGGWSSMWNGFVRPIAKDDPTLSTTIFSFLLLGRGIGNIVSTPISTALQRVHVSAAQSAHKLGFMVADGQYRDMIVYAGSMFAGAAVLAFFGWQADRYHR